MTANQAVAECTSQEAWDVVQKDEAAYIIDVRTDAEWAQVGAPDLDGLSHKLYFISWQKPPDMKINPSFLDELKATGVPVDGKLYFLCRSGVRSLAAAKAAAAAGYETTINISGGFEGVAGADGERRGGWLGYGLPHARYPEISA